MQRPNVEKMREQYSQYFMGGKPITVNLKDDIYSLFDYIDELEKEKENQPKRPNVEYAKLIAEYIHPFKENFVLDLCNYIEFLEKENQPNTNKRPDIEDIRLMVKTEKLRQKCGSIITYEDWAKTATKLCDHIEYLEKQLEISENKANAISNAWMKDHFTRIIDH